VHDTNEEKKYKVEVLKFDSTGRQIVANMERLHRATGSVLGKTRMKKVALRVGCLSSV
jgi:hypothetical protein